jgi:replicative DNA helicase
VKGYGKNQADRAQHERAELAKNRLREFVVQNKDVLKKEIERRRACCSKNEAVPSTGLTTPAPAGHDRKEVSSPLGTSHGDGARRR